MIDIIFNKPYLSQTSPVSVAFGLGYTPIDLVFDKSYTESTSPITILFGDGGIDPPVIIDDTIGIECGIVWVETLAPHLELEIVESSNCVEVNTDSCWLTISNNGININSNWASFISIGLERYFPWQINPYTRNDHSIIWTTPNDHLANLNVDWVGGDQVNDTVEVSWYNRDSININNHVSWVDGVESYIKQQIKYSSVSIGDHKVLRYGFKEPQWICSSDYIKPTTPITIRFSDPYAESTSPITIRFTPSDKVCKWYNGGDDLNGFPILPDLDFKVPIEPQIQRVYLMQPTLTCTRVSDGLPIVIIGVSIGDKRGQHSKSVSIEFSSRIDAERAENELLLISINGYDFYAVGEQPTRREIFGSATYSSDCRSRSSLLSYPWSTTINYTNDVSRSFAGLLGDLLENTGWTIQLDGVVDFNIPAGAFSIMGKTPIDAVAEAVAMIKCMTITDDATQVIKVVPQYPTSPWAMGSETPDVYLHDAVIIDFNSTKTIQPLYNSAWLRGEQHGISAQVKRAGTAGNESTTDFTSPLMVDIQAARVAGTSLIADSGRKELISLNLPVMNDLPPLTKGMLVGVTYRDEVFKATLDSVNITANMDNQNGLDVNQQIQLIRHLE
ncbi:hypothetical protein NVP1055O_29 [Vibrio phage 1.055.O._10N.286.55.E9]|nr:hypothetical protein NVP1055O_29 [Vibrio phage 1.055.O._10N.286.55.E9]